MTTTDMSGAQPTNANPPVAEAFHRSAAEMIDQRPPPGAQGGAGQQILDWAKRNLFSSPLDVVLTFLFFILMVLVIPPLLSWMFFDAVWSGEPQACYDASGACWAFVNEKYRIILFGTYPPDEHWRPILASALMIATVVMAMYRAFWKPWILPVIVGSLIVMGTLMWGGVLGMTYVENSRWGGLPLTLMLAVIGIGAAFPLGILLALGRQSDLPLIKTICVVFIEIVRGVPLITILFMASVMFPLFLPEGVTIDKLLRAQVGFIIFTSAYLAEVFRGGLQAIPKGQYEAADSLGLTYWQSMRMIILPQALRIVIPPTVNSFLSAFKDTSLVIIIGLFDLLGTVKLALTDPPWSRFHTEGYLFVSAIFFVLCYAMARYSRYLEVELRKGEKR